MYPQAFRHHEYIITAIYQITISTFHIKYINDTHKHIIKCLSLKEKYPLMLMGVLVTGSPHARTSNLPPIDMSGRPLPKKSTFSPF